MAKHKTSIPRPSSMRLLRNISALSRSPTPSSALLVILAGLVRSTDTFPVACPDSDRPPAFLCPSLHPRAEFDPQDFALPSQTPPSTSVPGPSKFTRTDYPTPRAEHNARRELPPGYTKGPDGRWRKLSTWSLYGSTICVVRSIVGFVQVFGLSFFFSLISVMTLLVQPRPNLLTTSHQPLRLQYPAKPTCFLPGGRGLLKRMPPGQSSSSRCPSYLPHSYLFSSFSCYGGGGGIASCARIWRKSWRKGDVPSKTLILRRNIGPSQNCGQRLPHGGGRIFDSLQGDDGMPGCLLHPFTDRIIRLSTCPIRFHQLIRPLARDLRRFHHPALHPRHRPCQPPILPVPH